MPENILNSKMIINPRLVLNNTKNTTTRYINYVNHTKKSDTVISRDEITIPRELELIQNTVNSVHSPTTTAVPCEAIVLDNGVSITDATQVINVTDVRPWEMINRSSKHHYTSNEIGVGESTHPIDHSNLLLRGSDEDKIITESQTYINTSTDASKVINVSMRDNMPRSIAPVNLDHSNSYMVSMLRQRLGHEFKRNCFYVIKSSVFRISDIIQAQKVFDYINNLSSEDRFTATARKEAFAIKKEIHELLCKNKNIDPTQSDDVYHYTPYVDATLGIVHLIYKIPIKSIPGDDHDDGSLFIHNLDICINVGLHQAPPIHPVKLTYDCQPTYNPGYIWQCTPQFLVGFSYHSAEPKKAVKLYSIVSGEVIELIPQKKIHRIDSAPDTDVQTDYVRVFNQTKTNDSNDQQLLLPQYKDYTTEDALASSVVYDSYDKAKHHLDKFGASLNVELLRVKSEVMTQENKIRELQAVEIKLNTIIKETEAKQKEYEQERNIKAIDLKVNAKQAKYKKKTDQSKSQLELMLGQQKIESAYISGQSQISIGTLKAIAATMSVAAAAVAVFKVYNK